MFAARFARHVGHTRKGRRRPADACGAESRTEYFATAVEAFFERPRQLRSREPQVYQQPVAFFRQDPAALPAAGCPWHGGPTARPGNRANSRRG